MLFFATPARGASPDPSTLEVDVVLVGAIGREATLPARIRSWFDPAKFVVSVQSSDALDVRRLLGPNGDRAAHVWITNPTTDHARFYFARASKGESTTMYLMRDLPLEHGLDELAAERIAQVCFLSTIALVEGQAESRKDEVEESIRTEQNASIVSAAAGGDTASNQVSPTGSPGAPTQRTAQPPSREFMDQAQGLQGDTDHRPTSRRVLHFGLGYGISLRGGEGIGHGPRGRMDARFGTVAVLVGVQSELPSTEKLYRLDLQFYALSFIAGVELRRDIRAVTLGLHAGPRLDVVHFSPHQTDPAVRAGAAGTEAHPAVNIGASIEFGPPLPRFAIIAELVARLSRTRYDLVYGNLRMAVAVDHLVVPTFAAELRF